jgi:hypothetical protein
MDWVEFLAETFEISSLTLCQEELWCLQCDEYYSLFSPEIKYPEQILWIVTVKWPFSVICCNFFIHFMFILSYPKSLILS